MGGLVANSYGIVRSTQDADIVVQVEEGRFDDFAQSLPEELRWNRDKDRDDARNILAVQGAALDFAYIERWCRAHGTLERLDELRRSIPPI